MLPMTLLVALSLGLLADPAAAPAPDYPLSGGGTTRDFDKPPPGTPADQALWQSSYDASSEVLLVQYAAKQLQYQARANLERLQDPAARGKCSKEDAEKLGSALADRLAANAQLMLASWPVSKLRGCRYELMNLEGVMLGGASPSRETQLADARRELEGCMAKATAVLDAARKANDALRAAIADAERKLPPVASSAAAATPAAAKD